MAEAIINAFPYCEDEYLKARAARALAATATAADADLLLRPRSRPMRDSAAGRVVEGGGDGCPRIASAGKPPKIVPETHSHTPSPIAVRLAAARALANLGNRSALPTLISLLESEDAEIRTTSVHVLRTFTGQNYEFMAYEDPKIRAD